ncbi:hypothetical protein [uncultured Sunxiuqinia sp.]|uniref:hypothetical protein n=1 Tax=uncultured Sunxiuqinia sp. TaxID=1573825 RepID=UPI00263756F4|nr:hypothetical protein [uncultured Sunxiuqinia sp.]
MPELLKKSEENIYSANLLIDNERYSSSVHCSYYACYQRLMNLISVEYGYDYEDINKEMREYNKALHPTKKIGSHDFLIKNKLNDLVRREKIDDHRLVNDLMILKTFRHKSDYKNVEISQEESRKALELSKEVIERLIKIS